MTLGVEARSRFAEDRRERRFDRQAANCKLRGVDDVMSMRLSGYKVVVDSVYFSSLLSSYYYSEILQPCSSDIPPPSA